MTQKEHESAINKVEEDYLTRISVLEETISEMKFERQQIAMALAGVKFLFDLIQKSDVKNFMP